MVSVPGGAACAGAAEQTGGERQRGGAGQLKHGTARKHGGHHDDYSTCRRERRPERAPLTEGDYLAACGALSAQRAISVFDGSVSSTSFFAVATPATGSRAGSSSPICTSTEA